MPMIRSTDTVTLRGSAVSRADDTPMDRRKDTKHIYIPGFGGGSRIHYDVNANVPHPVYSAAAEVTMAEGGKFPNHYMRPQIFAIAHRYEKDHKREG